MSACSLKLFAWDLKVEIERILTNLNTKPSECQRQGRGFCRELQGWGSGGPPRTNPPSRSLVQEPQGSGCRNRKLALCPVTKLTPAPLPSRCPELLPKRETETEDGSFMGKGTQSQNCPSSLLGSEAHEKYGS